MHSDSESRKLATLARVRNNQRRCRARKQQYIAELEQRVRQLEESRDQDETRDLRRKLEKLEQENGRLRAIIDGLDLGRPWLGMQPNAQVVVAGKTPLSQTTLNEKLPDAGAVQPLPVKLWSETQLAGSFSDDNYRSLPEILDSLFDGDAVDARVVETHLLDESPATEAADLMKEIPNEEPFITDEVVGANPLMSPIACHSSGQGGTEGDEEADGWPTSESDSSTTACPVAFELIAKFNHKNLTRPQIVSQLKIGFRRASRKNDDCRVDNKWLYNLLYEIVG